MKSSAHSDSPGVFAPAVPIQYSNGDALPNYSARGYFGVPTAQKISMRAGNFWFQSARYLDPLIASFLYRQSHAQPAFRRYHSSTQYR